MLQPRNRPPKWMLILAPIAGLLLLYPLAALFDAKHWPIFNSWAMLHATILIAWPALSFASLVLIQIIRHLTARIFLTR